MISATKEVQVDQPPQLPPALLLKKVKKKSTPDRRRTNSSSIAVSFDVNRGPLHSQRFDGLAAPVLSQSARENEEGPATTPGTFQLGSDLQIFRISLVSF